jgi:LPXTG-motif cell wall-anchored protein
MMWDVVRFIAFLFVLVWLTSLCFADKVIHEPYPWPNAEYPSREKPMRREFTEPLEFGEKYPKAESAPNQLSTKTSKPSRTKVVKKKASPKPKVKVKKKIVPVPEVKPELAPPLMPVAPELPVIREEESTIADAPETPLRGKPETVIVATERSNSKLIWLGLIIIAGLGAYFWRRD